MNVCSGGDCDIDVATVDAGIAVGGLVMGGLVVGGLVGGGLGSWIVGGGEACADGMGFR